MKALFGTKTVEVASVKTDGSIPLDKDFTELCKTYRDTVEIVQEEPNITEEFCDQENEPIAVFTEAGKTSGKFSTFEFDTITLTKLMGGTVVDDKWTEGNNLGIEVALRFKTDSGHVISYPRVKLFARMNIKLTKKAVSLIEVSFTPMSKAQISKS